MRRFLFLIGVGGASILFAPSAFAGERHWGYASTPKEAAAIANKAAKRRAKKRGTCVTTKAIWGTPSCKVGGPKGYQCYAISANWRGSC